MQVREAVRTGYSSERGARERTVSIDGHGSSNVQSVFIHIQKRFLRFLLTVL